MTDTNPTLAAELAAHLKQHGILNRNAPLGNLLRRIHAALSTRPSSALGEELDRYIQAWLNAKPMAAHDLAAFVAGARDRLLAALSRPSADFAAGVEAAAKALIDEGPTCFRTTTWHNLALALGAIPTPAPAPTGEEALRRRERGPLYQRPAFECAICETPTTCAIHGRCMPIIGQDERAALTKGG